MKNPDIITLEAVGEFPFEFSIEKAVATDADEELIIEGIASTTNIDHDKERMSEEALRSMEAAINDGGVPLRVEHSKGESAIIGKVYKGWVDERNQLHIRARLDKSHAVSPILHASMKQGLKMGLSVGGLVKRAVREFAESAGGMVKTFYDITLNEVSVTPRPANYDSWLVAKSIKTEADSADDFRGTPFYREFLLENPRLDYLTAFAKSIPDAAWHKSVSTKTTMAKEKMEVESTEETEKAVSRGEFTSLKNLVAKGFESMVKAMEGMSGGAKDTVNPDKAKPEPEKVTAKNREGQEDSKGNGSDEDGEREKASKEDETEKTSTEDETKEKAEGGAKDQNNPDKAKPEPEKVTAKAESEDETKEKAAKAKNTDEEYDLESVERATKSMEALASRFGKSSEESETAEFRDKAETETDETTKAEEETETTKGQHPVDRLVMTMAKAMEAMGDSLAKSGKRVPGFEKHIVDELLADKGFTDELASMMKVPGFKKSVSMGVPYVPLKEGGRLALSVSPSGGTTVEKSRQLDTAKPASFKDVYKKEFSSFAEQA